MRFAEALNEAVINGQRIRCAEWKNGTTIYFNRKENKFLQGGSGKNFGFSKVFTFASAAWEVAPIEFATLNNDMNFTSKAHPGRAFRKIVPFAGSNAIGDDGKCHTFAANAAVTPVNGQK